MPSVLEISGLDPKEVEDTTGHDDRKIARRKARRLMTRELLGFMDRRGDFPDRYGVAKSRNRMRHLVSVLYDMAVGGEFKLPDGSTVYRSPSLAAIQYIFDRIEGPIPIPRGSGSESPFQITGGMLPPSLSIYFDGQRAAPEAPVDGGLTLEGELAD